MRKHRILLVDDEPDILESYQHALQTLIRGLVVDVASSPGKALDAAAAQRFDIIISDYRMPEMDGLEFLARVHRFQPLARRLLLSAYASPELEEKASRSADAYLSKTVDLDVLVGHIEQALQDGDATASVD
jgi:CheY-like chemotaxis protein